MSIYETLGVRTVINVAGPVTRLSGAPLAPGGRGGDGRGGAILRAHRGSAGGRRARTGGGDGRGGGLRDGGGGGRAGARRGGLHRRARCRGDGSPARHDRAAQRDRHPAPPPDGVHARPAPRRGEARRGRLSRLSGAGDHLALADRGGDHRADGRHRLLVRQRAGRRAAGGGRRHRAPARPAGDRRRARRRCRPSRTCAP